MQHYDFWGYQAKLDKTATRAWYEKAGEWGCECGHCRNFLELARQKQLPSAVLDLLGQLEIPPEKATYVCELYPTEQGNLYQFNYRIAGCILNENPQQEPVPIEGGTVCCGHDPYPYGALDFPEPHFDLVFFAELPWVLDEPRRG